MKFEQVLDANGIIVRMYGPVGKITKFMYYSIMFKPKLNAKAWTDKDSRLHFTVVPIVARAYQFH